MNISVEHITDLVAVALGEYPLWKGSQAQYISQGIRLDEMVLPLIEIYARKAVSELNLEECTDLIDLTPTIVSATDWGEETLFSCSLPSDFMRLHSLWMPDWPKPLNQDATGDAMRGSLGEKAPEWLRQRSNRPFIRIFPATDATPAQIYFGPTKARRPMQAAYVAIPMLDDTDSTLLNFQPAALSILIDAIANHLAKSPQICLTS